MHKDLEGKILGKGRLYNPLTQLRCGLGQLLHAQGIPDTTLEFEEGVYGRNIQLLGDVYGITPEEVDDITDTNDQLSPKRTRITGDQLIAALIRG